jgi:hypothetical protein
MIQVNAFSVNKPVAFLVFNRPETTARVFEAIRQARPPILLVVADGPRTDKPGETERCVAVRAIVDRVDWPCEVLKNYSDTNLGCKRRVSSGLNWVFETVEEAIILEDDCLPHPTFFRFCEELLDRYRDDERVAMISGDNFQFGKQRTEYSYYFSIYPHIWGWASWRRVWRNYDVCISKWPAIRDGDWLFDQSGDRRRARYWANIFQRTYTGEIDTWDYQLVFTVWINHGINILPKVNLVTNIGFGATATRTRGNTMLNGLEVYPMEFPLRHPPHMIPDWRADRNEFDTIFRPTMIGRIKHLCGGKNKKS